MRLYESLVRMLDRYGEAMTLRRAGAADITVKAKRYNANGQEIAGALDDTVVTIKISNAEIAGSAAPSQAPRQGDTIGGFVIGACDTRKVKDTTVLHILSVSGSG